MSKFRTIAFVKFFSEEAHADQFISGNLFMRKLGYFQNLEAEKDDDGRPDAQEAVWMWHQPDQVVMEFTVEGVGSIRIDSKDLAGPVSSTLSFYSDIHVFCMTTLSIPDPKTLVGDYDQVLAQVRAAYQVDPRCLDFGPHVVLVYARPFLTQLSKALNRLTYWRGRNLVEYYDETTYSGTFDKDDVPWRKQSKFAYQKEFRICLQTPPGTSDPFLFDVGDMSSFAIKLPSADLNKSLHVDLKEKA